MTYDVQLTYLQLEARVNALLTLHRTISKWLMTLDESSLTATLQPFATLLSRLIMRERSLHPQLRPGLTALAPKP